MDFALAQSWGTCRMKIAKYFVVWSLLFFKIEVRTMHGDWKAQIAWKEGENHAVN